MSLVAGRREKAERLRLANSQENRDIGKSNPHMVKKITLSRGLAFETLKAAKSHFSGIREGLAVGRLLDEPARSDVLEVYRRYCEATAWTPIDAIDVTASLDEKVRSRGDYARSKALAVVDAFGGQTIFSVDKALKAIAV